MGLHRRAAPVVLALSFLAPFAAPAQGAASPEQKCQAATASVGRALLARSLASAGRCRQAIGRGTLAPDTDCLARVRGSAAARVTRRLTRKCTDATARNLAPGGECDGVTTIAALVACLRTTHETEAATLMGVADAGRPTASARARRCQRKTSAVAATTALTRLRLLQRCKLRPPQDLAPGTACSAHPATATRLEAARRAGLRKITAACDDAPYLGPPCAGGGSVAAAAECVLAAAEAASAGALAAEFPHEGFCGDATVAVEARLDELLAQMTLEEKLGLMHGTGAMVGGVWQVAGVPRLGVPALGLVDGPRGVSAATGRSTTFPVGMARGATWDPALEARVGEVMGTEARARGAGVLLAPTINMLRHPRWGRAQETYSEDTHLLSRMGVGFVRGVQRRAIANPKHFAANSIEDTRFNVNVVLDARTLREIYLPHFRSAVREGNAGSVMTAYNKVNGAYCAENAPLLRDVLKGDWAFQGFVESDWVLGTRSTLASLDAGLDIEMPGDTYFGAPLANAVAKGQASPASIDAAVRRVLRAEVCFRLDTDPPRVDPARVETAEHGATALEVARKGIVLLKNAGALPIARAQATSIVVVGDLADVANLGDTGSSAALPTVAITPLAGITAAAGEVTVSHVASGALSPDDQTRIAAADAVVVVAGLTAADEGEGLISGGDRDSLALPAGQDALIAAAAALNPRTIVVLEGSGALTMPWLDDVGAVLMAWYPGQAGGTAIAEILFGDVVPSGKLPASFPRAEADLPPFDNVGLTVPYGYFHGYRWLDRTEVAPLFPFGFGLSYTSFAYANLTVSSPTLAPYGRLRVTADVTNTGTLAGDEVAQLYVGYRGSAVERAVHDLKGFARVTLAPGETRTVAFDLRAADLAYWDGAAGAWVLEPITYEVRVGSSSRDLPLEGAVTVAP
ncbi:MAG: glycoside hydrolase family 3 C-terminal domain-containing protein [bacterium]|nr:glycoside hydrolase family 3 C-terminal domain-containing protein [bacterium]